MTGLYKPIDNGPEELPSPTGFGSSPFVDPLTEISQPGGPFPYGHAVIADGIGGYAISATLRPYLLCFELFSREGKSASVVCRHQGVDMSACGIVLPFSSNLIAISISVDTSLAEQDSYRVEVVRNPTGGSQVVGALDIDGGRRKALRRDLSIEIPAATEIGIRVLQLGGGPNCPFSSGIVCIELET